MKTTRRLSALKYLMGALGIAAVLWAPAANLCYAGDAEELLKQASSIKNQDDGFRTELRVRGDKENFKIGDSISFVFKTSKDCYLTLIDIGPNGKPVIIFPNKWIKSNFVKAGREYIIPPDDSKYSMIADEPKGVEMVKAIASLEPLKALANADLTQVGNFRIIEKPGAVLKGIRMEMGEKKKDEWSTSEVVFSIDVPSKP
jgi:hypothetical protein